MCIEQGEGGGKVQQNGHSGWFKEAQRPEKAQSKLPHLTSPTFQNKERVAARFHRQDTISQFKKFNAKRKLKVRSACCDVLYKPGLAI